MKKINEQQKLIKIISDSLMKVNKIARKMSKDWGFDAISIAVLSEVIAKAKLKEGKEFKEFFKQYNGLLDVLLET